MTLIGSGAVGSFAALVIGKMGLSALTVFDEDGVAAHNLPNQFFPHQELGAFKVSALARLLAAFSSCAVSERVEMYAAQPLTEVVICAPDSMRVRRMVWEQFRAQDAARFLIEARMGAEIGRVYCIDKDAPDYAERAALYEAEALYSDDAVPPAPCTAQTIIYNVVALAALMARALKGRIMEDAPPFEQILNLARLSALSYMVR